MREIKVKCFSIDHFFTKLCRQKTELIFHSIDGKFVLIVTHNSFPMKREFSSKCIVKERGTSNKTEIFVERPNASTTLLKFRGIMTL